MAEHRTSLWKTTAAAVAACLVGLAALAALPIAAAARSGAWSSAAWFAFAASLAIALAATTGACLVTLGGCMALRRDRLEANGLPYAPTSRRESVSGVWHAISVFMARASARGRRLSLRPGEVVEIRSLEDILQTLDDRGSLGGVPFTEEMAAYCGVRTRVLRRVDKLHDWIGLTGLHRMRDLVQLEDLRCDGSAHGGCQSNCRLRWHEAWLRRCDAGTPRSPAQAHARGAKSGTSELRQFATRIDPATGATRYVCQATQLTAGGTPMQWTDPRHLLRDLVTGNVRPGPLVVAVALSCFNWVQRRRGGVAFPHYEVGTSKSSPQELLNLAPGELVRVKSKQRIGPTLNSQSRNRGLYFDRDMIRYCGGEYRVRSLAADIIVEKTGEMRHLTAPCVILDGVTATGEYLGFNPEDEHIFWREIWLERVAPASSSVEGSAPMPAGAPVHSRNPA